MTDTHVPDLAGLSRDQRVALCRSLLAEFNAQRINLQGDELHHSCVLPFGLHRNGDRHPSAAINVDKLVYSCFVCGGGSLVWWIATCRGLSTHQARGWLANETGIDGTNLAGLLRFFDEIYDRKEIHPEKIPTYSPKVLEQWAYIHPYMTEIRKVPVETLLHFKVGWDPATDRIVIPHYWEGRLVGWQSRRIANDGSLRYRSSPEFPKDQTIFNYDRRRQVAVVVESPMSVLARWHQCPIIEATIGSVMPQSQLRLLAKHERVILFFDNDEAGWKATMHVGDYLSRYCDVRVVENPWAADAADLTDEDFGQLMANPVPFGIWNPPNDLLPYGGENGNAPG